jgi:hypothetical protein
MFYQNSAAREPPRPVPSLADGHCCTCVEVADRLPGISGQGLSISQEYSALLQGMDTHRQDRISFWLGIPHGNFPFGGPSFTRTWRVFPIKKS